MDSVDKQHNFKGMVLGAAVIAFIVTVNADSIKLTPFPCVMDVCNRFDKPQFCNTDRCLNCEDKKRQCGTWEMPANCSNYCWERKTNEFIDRTCPPPWNISNGFVNVSSTSYGRHLAGTTLTYVCHMGYEMNGDDTFLCNDQGRWSPETASPFCTPLSTLSQLAWIITVIVLIVIICILVVVILWKRRNMAKTKTCTKKDPTESTEAMDEETSLIENDRTNDEEAQKTIPNGNDQHVVNMNDRDRQPDAPRDTENAGVVTDDNTDPKKSMETPNTPRRELDGTASLSRSRDYGDEVRTKYPIQAETLDEDKGTSPLSPRNEQDNHVCEELGGPGNKRKMALGQNTFNNSDIARNSNRNVL